MVGCNHTGVYLCCTQTVMTYSSCLSTLFLDFCLLILYCLLWLLCSPWRQGSGVFLGCSIMLSLLCHLLENRRCLYAFYILILKYNYIISPFPRSSHSYPLDPYRFDGSFLCFIVICNCINI